MLWQALAMAPAAAAWLDDAADIGHVALHVQEEGHHHHDDGSFAVDQSSDSVLHLVADHVAQSPIRPTLLPMAALPAQSPAPDGQRARVTPAPFLEGPLRPPRVAG